MEFGLKTSEQTWNEYYKNAPPWNSLPIEEKRRSLKWKAKFNRENFPGIKPEIYYDHDGLRHEIISCSLDYRSDDPSTYPVSPSESCGQVLRSPSEKKRRDHWTRLEEARQDFQIPDWVEQEDRKKEAKKQKTKAKAKANKKDSKKNTVKKEIMEKKKAATENLEIRSKSLFNNDAKLISSESELNSVIENQQKEIDELKKKLEEYELCKICYEPFDENLRAKYGHACGHGACKKCIKMDFSRQKEAKKQKFYCHCGFQIHEKKIIRLFL